MAGRRRGRYGSGIGRRGVGWGVRRRPRKRTYGDGAGGVEGGGVISISSLESMDMKK